MSLGYVQLYYDPETKQDKGDEGQYDTFMDDSIVGVEKREKPFPWWILIIIGAYTIYENG